MRGADSFCAYDITDVKAPRVSESFSVVTTLQDAREAISLHRDSLRSITAPFAPSPPGSDEMLANMYRDMLSRVESVASRDPFHEALENTLQHIFEQCRAAVYVLIVNGHLRIFLPICNVQFTNMWDLSLLRPQSSASEDRSAGFVMDPREWWCNAGVICNRRAVPPSPPWSFELLRDYRDLIVSSLRAMRDRRDNLAWCEFVLNKRDHPMVRSDGTAYPYVYGPRLKSAFVDVKLRTPMLPFVSQYTQLDAFSDLPLPVAADLRGYPSSPSSPSCAPLSARLPCAVWRGSATGWGVTAETNPRIRIAHMSVRNPAMLDAKLVSDSGRSRVDPFTGAMVVMHEDALKDLPVGKNHYLPQSSQNEYAIQIYIPGHAAASRLGAQLASGSVVLMVSGHPDLPASPLEMWYTRFLRSGVDYLPVRFDLSDLESTIEWVLTHLDEAQHIADSSVSFAQRYLTPAFQTEQVLPTLLQQITYQERYQFGDEDAPLPACTSVTEIRELIAKSL